MGAFAQAALAVAMATSTFGPGDLWWSTAMEIPQMHRSGAKGQGARIALLAGPMDPGSEILAGTKVASSENLCGPPVETEEQTETMTAHLAALVASSGQARSMTGVAPGATVYHYTVLGGPECPGADAANSTALARAITAATEQADIILVPWPSKDNSVAVNQAIGLAADRGALVITGATGLGPNPGNVVPVLGATVDGRPASPVKDYSQVLFTAPGDFVITGLQKEDSWSPTGYLYGDAPAATIVAGVLGVMKVNAPDATNKQVLQHAIRTAPSVRYSNKFGFGAISPVAMLDSSPQQWRNQWWPEQSGTLAGLLDEVPNEEARRKEQVTPEEAAAPRVVIGRDDGQGGPGSAATIVAAVLTGSITSVLIGVGGWFIWRLQRKHRQNKARWGDGANFFDEEDDLWSED